MFWEKDDNRVDTSMDGRVEVINQANLSLVLIRKAQTSDVGRYSCVAYNIVGKQMSTTIKLNVYGEYTSIMYQLTSHDCPLKLGV